MACVEKLWDEGSIVIMSYFHFFKPLGFIKYDVLPSKYSTLFNDSSLDLDHLHLFDVTESVTASPL